MSAERERLFNRIFPVWGQEDSYRTWRIVDAVMEIVAPLDLPVVPVGTSIRLEFTEDGWVDRGRLTQFGPRLLSPEDRKKFPRMWVDGPSTETTE
jgi:hypothetical protein